MIFRNDAHGVLFEKEIRLHKGCGKRFTAALFLLTADYRLWVQVEPFVGRRSIDIESARPQHLNGLSYVCFALAKDILTGSRTVMLGELADPIKRLFKGDVYPEEDVLPQSAEFEKAKSERNRLLDKLEETLSKEQVELLNEMQTADADMTLMEFEAHFAEGMRFGIQLMWELFPMEKPEWAGKEWPGE